MSTIAFKVAVVKFYKPSNSLLGVWGGVGERGGRQKVTKNYTNEILTKYAFNKLCVEITEQTLNHSNKQP